MKQSLKAPVIIVGAGPAGAGTSIYLSKAGIPHIIIEKETFPRDKVCGDGCSGKTAFVLRKANPSWLHEIYRQEADYLPSKGIIFVAPNGKPLTIPYGEHKIPGEPAPGFTATRLKFDNFLFSKLDKNYATIFQKASIQSVERNGNKVTVIFVQDGTTYEAEADMIVGADGDKSIVRKTLLNAHASPKAYTVGLRAYYSGVTEMHKENYIELHFLPELLPGYFWIFPLPNGMANVGVGILSERIRTKKINLREQMLRAIEVNPTISHRFKNAKLEGKIQGWGLPMCIEQLPVSGDHFLLTGDAASLVDPFSGEGIGNALYSGMVAAEAIQQSLEQKRFDASFLKEHYDDSLYRRLAAELKISKAMQRLCNYPWIFNFVANKASKSPSLSNTISNMFTDLDLRDKIRKPSFYLKILFNR